MANPFLSEIKIMSFGFPPKGWALCNGALMQINQNQPLFSLLGATFGGDGKTTFALPDLQGRTPIHVGSGHTLGERGGEQAHTLSLDEMPMHTHVANATNTNGAVVIPGGAVLGAFNNAYTQPTNLVALDAATIANVGDSQAHLNMQPYLTLSFCIALQGVYPSKD